MEKKYKLTDECVAIGDRQLYRIEALKDFSDVKRGDKGGFIESEKNLSQEGDCWVCGDARVYDDAEVYGNAEVYGDARVCGDARVYGNAMVCGDARVYGNVELIKGVVKNKADYIVFKNWWSSGRYFTWTRSNNMWRVGCFYGTGEELIAKAYKRSELSGREYKRIVDYVKSIIKDSEKVTNRRRMMERIKKSLQVVRHFCNNRRWRKCFGSSGD